MKSLKGKVAIITGSGQGIGKGIAESLAREGSDVVVSDITGKQDQVAEELKKYDVNTLAVQCDVSKRSDVDQMVKLTLDTFGKIDVLVNNAGIYPYKSFLEMEEEDWDTLMDINLKGTFNCTQAVLPSMIEQGKGRIINISSIAGTEIGYKDLVHYSTSKAGLLGFTRALALEMADKGITVNSIAPGAVETPGTAESISEEEYQQMKQAIPIGRWGKPSDIGDLVAFIASDKSDFITGRNIVADGGDVLH